MSKKQKYYVVWKGVSPGVYTSWTDCQLQVKGFDGALYKSFDTQDEAEHAFASPAHHYIGTHNPNLITKTESIAQLPQKSANKQENPRPNSRVFLRTLGSFILHTVSDVASQFYCALHSVIVLRTV